MIFRYFRNLIFSCAFRRDLYPKCHSKLITIYTLWLVSSQLFESKILVEEDLMTINRQFDRVVTLGLIPGSQIFQKCINAQLEQDLLSCPKANKQNSCVTNILWLQTRVRCSLRHQLFTASIRMPKIGPVK